MERMARIDPNHQTGNSNPRLESGWQDYHLRQSLWARTPDPEMFGSFQTHRSFHLAATPENSLMQMSPEAWTKAKEYSPWSSCCQEPKETGCSFLRPRHAMWGRSTTAEATTGFRCLGRKLWLWGLSGSRRGFQVDAAGGVVAVIGCLRACLVVVFLGMKRAELSGRLLQLRCRYAFLGKWFRKLFGLHRIFALAWLPNSPGHFDGCTYNSLCTK